MCITCVLHVYYVCITCVLYLLSTGVKLMPELECDVQNEDDKLITVTNLLVRIGCVYMLCVFIVRVRLYMCLC